jgi:hypothetical protein
MTMPTPIQPEDLTPDQLSLVPNPPQERTATALMALLNGVSEGMHVPADELVNLQGAVLEHGSVAVFGRLPFPGAMEYVGHIVGYFQPGKGNGFSAVDYETADEAVELYAAVVKRLSASPSEPS